MMDSLLLAASLVVLPAQAQCQAAALHPDTAWAQSVGLQGFVYGYPIVDLLKQQHHETHRIRPDQPVVAPVNRVAVYPGVLTPATQGQLRAANADTLYLNAWVDLSRGPVLLEVPDMAGRYYTLAFMDLYGRPHHLGTRTNGGAARRYALVGPSGGEVPAGHEVFLLPTDTAWMLGRVMVADAKDEPAALQLAARMVLRGAVGPEPRDAQTLKPFDSLLFFAMLNRALKSLPARPEEAALMAQFNAAGFGPGQTFDPAKISPEAALGLGCALRAGPQLLARRGFKPTRVANGWMESSEAANPGLDYLLRAEIARGGYVNAPEESIYPAAVTDHQGKPLSGAHRYRIRFPKGGLPPVDAFWSITAYDSKTAQLTENELRRYAIGDRTPGLLRGSDGSLDIILAATRPPEGSSNWLPVPPGAFHLVSRLYLPRAEALNGQYRLPPVERLD